MEETCSNCLKSGLVKFANFGLFFLGKNTLKLGARLHASCPKTKLPSVPSDSRYGWFGSTTLVTETFVTGTFVTRRPSRRRASQASLVTVRLCNICHGQVKNRVTLPPPSRGDIRHGGNDLFWTSKPVKM